jgi:hypothetical protein
MSAGKRKARLARLLARAPPGIALNEHTDADSATVFRHACAMGLEGIVSKRLTAPYRSGPSRDWIKVKNPDSPAMARHREGTYLVTFPMPSELTIEQRRALQLLAEAPNGYTEAALRARGFTPTLLVELAARGYVVPRTESMNAAGKTFGFMRFVITDSGRTAIG